MGLFGYSCQKCGGKGYYRGQAGFGGDGSSGAGRGSLQDAYIGCHGCGGSGASGNLSKIKKGSGSVSKATYERQKKGWN